MSDDLPPVDGHVLPDDARRLATGRTLVNLDAVDFAPILAALELLSVAARWYANRNVTVHQSKPHKTQGFSTLCGDFWSKSPFQTGVNLEKRWEIGHLPQ